MAASQNAFQTPIKARTLFHMPSKTTPEVLTAGHIIDPSNVYAGFWLRFAAVIIDGVLLGIVNQLLGLNEHQWFISAIITLVYYAGMESSKYQGTLGKIALGLRVTDMNGSRTSPLKAVLRNLGKYVSAFILCIGFLMIAFTAKKQGLHDIMAGTLVVKRK